MSQIAKSCTILTCRFANVMLADGTDRYGAVHSPLFASVLLLQSRPVLPDAVQLSQFEPAGAGIFRPNNFPNVFPGACIWGPEVICRI